MIELVQVRKEYPTEQGPFIAVDDVTLSIPSGTTCCLIGTSGSGKTTTLKMINRMIEPSSGLITINGTSITEYDVIQLRRSMGYVIQRGGLFPHMTIEENISLLPNLEGKNLSTTLSKTRDLIAMMNLNPDEVLDRYPSELSGGQQQRVGVARALALDPDIILMDEPFGALDPVTRTQVHEEFIQLQKQFHKTFIIVTHDMEEAFKLGDQIVLMDQGSIVQKGSQKDFLHCPANDFVEDFVSSQIEGNLAQQSVSNLMTSISDEEALQISVSCQASSKVLRALKLMLNNNTRTLKVLNQEGKAIGKISDEIILEQLS